MAKFGWSALHGAMLSATVALALSGGATAAQLECDGPDYLMTPAKRISLDTRYPKGQESKYGEGWVRLGYTVTPAGSVSDIWLVDIIGAPIFAHASAGSLAKSRWQPAMRDGTVVPFHSEFDFQYYFAGGNRAGVHARVSGAYDLAKIKRDNGDYQASVDILKEVLKLTLNMYEYAITTYGLTYSYLGLRDRRRALLHARHTAVGGGIYADKGQRRTVFSVLAELEALDNNFHDGLCAAEKLRKQPGGVVTARLQGLLATAERELTATTPVRTEVELVESGRDDLATMWRHRVLRPRLAFSAVEGTVKNVRVVCPASMIDEPLTAGRAIDVDLGAGACTLFVFGDAGAKFVLDER